MSKFIKYDNKYINLDHVSKIEMEKAIDEINYIDLYLANKDFSCIQIKTKDDAKAQAIFDKIGAVIEAKELLDFDDLGIQLKPSGYIESAK